MKPNFFRKFTDALAVLRSGLPAAWFDRVWSLGDGANGVSLGQPFAESVWVMRAIKKISGPIAAVPLKFCAGDEEIEDPRLEAFWHQPVKGLSRHDFIEASVSWLKLEGEAFWLMGDDMLRPFPEVASFTPLILARPDRMREVIAGNDLAGWQYTDRAAAQHRLLPEQVIQCKFWNPYDDFRGLAEYQAARLAAESDYAAGKYSRSLMANNGDTGPIISTKTGVLDDAQQKQIVASLRQKQESARRGEFRAAFLTADVSVQNPTAQTVDANFAAMRLGNRHEIFLAFGVPPSMADKMESYSIGSASDWFMLITETCIPTSEKLAAGIAAVARKQLGRPDLECYFDWDDHPVMQAVRRERLDSVEKLWSKGMSMAAANDYLGLGMEQFPGWEVGYLPFSVAPVAEVNAAPDETTAPANADQPDPVEQMMRALRSPASSTTAVDDETVIERCACCDHGPAIRATDFQSTRPPRQRAQWRNEMKKRLPTIRAYQAKFNRVLMGARAEVLAKLERAGELGLRSTTRAAAVDFLFNLAGLNSKLQAAMRAQGLDALRTAGQQMFADLGQDDPFTMPPAKAIEFVKARENRLSNVPDDVFARIKDALEEGLNEGDSIKALSDRVRAEFNGIGKEQGLRIAMTETAAAYGTARQEAMEQAGIQSKEWLTSGNANVRAAHELMNGTKVGIAENFTVIDPRSGESDQVKHPGDPTGKPWNVINCHCIALSVADEENA